MDPQEFGRSLALLRTGHRKEIRQSALAKYVGVPKSRIDSVEKGLSCLTKPQLGKYLEKCGVGQEDILDDYWQKMLDARDHVKWVLQYANVSKEVFDKVIGLHWAVCDSSEETSELVAPEAD